MSRPLRVLLVLGTSTGGVGRHVRDLATSLADAGAAVVVAGPDETLTTLGLGTTGVRTFAVRIGERPRPGSDPVAAKAIRWLSRRADVVHAHGLRAGGLAALGLIGRPQPLVVTLHNALLRGGPTAAAYQVLEHLVARRADAVLAVSPDLEARMEQLGARRVARAVVPAPPERPLVAGRAAVRAGLNLAEDRPLVVSVARLTDQKGLPALLDLAAHAPAWPSRPVFVVAGEGPAKDELQQRISREDLPVQLLGRRTDVPELLAAADAVVSTAVWEGQPIWLQEALRAGAPIVATDAGGTAWVVGDAAALVPIGDSAALSAALRSVLEEPSRAARMRESSLAQSARLPRTGDARDAVLAVYQEVTGRGLDDC